MKTTIQISESLRRQLKALSSYRGISYTELLEDLISVFTSSVLFKSEEEFKEWFEKNLEKFGFKKIVEKRLAASPDYRLQDEKGNIKEVEIELIGEDFSRHGHDPKKTDVIVCLYSTKDEIDGVPVLSIMKPPEDPREVIERMRGRFRTVSIPAPLFQKIEKFIKKTGFTSVSSFVEYLVRETLARERKKGQPPFTEEDKERIRKRLRALGYLE